MESNVSLEELEKLEKKNKKRLMQKMISCVIAGVFFALSFFGGKTLIAHFNKIDMSNSLLFSNAANTDNGQTGEYSLPINKEISTVPFTEQIKIENTKDSDIVINGFTLQNEDELSQYFNSLTITVNNTNIISENILDNGELIINVPKGDAATVIIEYSLYSNKDLSKMPNEVVLTPVFS